METTSHETTIKIHTIRLDDREVAHLLDHPDELNDLLSTLLTAKPAPANGDRPPAKPMHKLKSRKQSRVICQYCARKIAQPWIDRHESTCPQRPIAE